MRSRVRASSGCRKVSPALVVVAVALKQGAGFGKARQIVVGKLVGLFGSEREAVARELDGRRHDALEAELAIFLFSVDEAGDGARRGDGAVADDAGIRE